MIEAGGRLHGLAKGDGRIAPTVIVAPYAFEITRTKRRAGRASHHRRVLDAIEVGIETELLAVGNGERIGVFGCLATVYAVVDLGIDVSIIQRLAGREVHRPQLGVTVIALAVDIWLAECQLHAVDILRHHLRRAHAVLAVGIDISRARGRHTDGGTFGNAPCVTVECGLLGSGHGGVINFRCTLTIDIIGTVSTV